MAPMEATRACNSPPCDRAGTPARRTALAAGAVLVTAALALCGAAAFAAETGPALRWDLGPAGALLHFLGAQPFVLLFLVLALGTIVGRRKIGFLSLGSTAGTLLVGILISLWAYLGYELKYDVPALLTTVSLNLFMFAVGLKVGPQFFAGLRLDGIRLVAIGLVVVGLNFAIAFGAAKALRLESGFATGLIAGSMTDTAVIGAATGAVQSGSYRPPQGVTPEDVIGNVAAGYAITYLFSLIGIILLVRYLPRLSGVDAKAAAREAEASYGGGAARLPVAGTDAAGVMAQLGVDVRAYRVENPALIGQRLHEAAARADVPVLQLLRNGAVVDLETDPVVEKGDIVTVVSEVDRLVSKAPAGIGPEVADEQARRLDLEVADIVVTNKVLVGLTVQEALERVRGAVFPDAARVGRLLQVVGYIRAGEPFPVYPGTRVEHGDLARVLGPKARIDQVGKHVGAVVRATTVSDILTMALGLAIGYVIGYLNVSIGGIPISLGTPAGVMLAGIAISTLRSRYPLFGGPVSEGARSLLQDLGLDLFIAVVALNTAPNVVAAFAGGGVLGILIIGVTAALIPPLVAWVVGMKLLKLNPAVLMGALAGARFCTPALRAAQEEADSAVPGVGYPVPYAVTAVLVLVAGYLALFL
jgi:putative transport protein